MATDEAWSGRLLLAPGLVLYLGAGGKAARHHHHAVQLVWTRGGKTTLSLPDGTVRVSAALVPARVAHAFDSHGHPLALLLVDAHGARGVALHRLAERSVGRDLAPRLGDRPFPSSIDDANDVLGALGAEATGLEAPSRATRRAVRYIERTLDGVPRISEAAAHAGISSSRLSHRFTEEIGIPFRRFILWTRLKRAVEIVQGGGDLTTAATGAGFSDSAHLSRTFRDMFGLSPSRVLPFVELVGRPWTT